MKVYVAGPLTSDKEYNLVSDDVKQENVQKAIDVAIELLDRGHDPYIPHLTYYVNKRLEEQGRGLTPEQFLKWDFAFLDDCQAIFFIGESWGANKEIIRACKNRMKVYFSIEVLFNQALGFA